MGGFNLPDLSKSAFDLAKTMKSEIPVKRYAENI
jgi:hypothetical protein